MTDRLLDELERYYDEVPRAFATVRDLGPFAVFTRLSPRDWPYYARPRLGYAGGATVEDVDAVRAVQREAGDPESFEWVVENAPDLGDLLARAGLQVTEYPLMVLGSDVRAVVPPEGIRVELLGEDHPALGTVRAAVGASFGDTDDVAGPGDDTALRDRVGTGLFRTFGAFDADGPVGGGSHSPRDGVTELAGIGVLPRARDRGVGAALTAALVDDARSLGVRTVFLSAGDDRIARIYGRVGFERVGTAGIAEADAG